jgi:hypothetical protein
LLTAVKEAMLPVPLPARPMDVFVFVQLYTTVPPVVGLPKFTWVAGALLHITWLGTAVTVAVGFTVIVKLVGVPVQVVPALL